MKPIPLYWMQTRNFGDALNPILYRCITGREPEFSDASPKILAIGSIMSAARPWDIIWGAGCISADTPLQCDQSTHFLAVRGPLTAEILRGHGIDLPHNLLYGEAASLLPDFIAGSENRVNAIGFLPHYIDLGQVGELPYYVKLLSPATDPVLLIKEITGCELIVTSSLHGIIVAEAYGIPAVWVILSNNVIGNGFKFNDYYLKSRRQVAPLDWRSGYNWSEAHERARMQRISPQMQAETNEQLMSVCPFGVLEAA